MISRRGIRPWGIDAPICQDTRSGGRDDLLASAASGHDALVDLASEETFQAPDDLSLGSAVRRAACDVINGRLMVPPADDDGSIERGGGVSVAASSEAVPAGGPPGRGRDRTRAAERRESGVRTNPVGMIAEDDQQFGDVSVVRRARCWSCIAISSVRTLQRRASARRVYLADAVGVSRGPGRSLAPRVSRP